MTRKSFVTRTANILAGSSIVAAAVLTVALTTPVQVQAQNGPTNVCLNVTEIQNTQATDARTIVYRMRDGKVWRNRLATPCPHLVNQPGGYTQKMHTDWICANTQTITVNATGMVCRLGEFTRVN